MKKSVYTLAGLIFLFASCETKEEKKTRDICNDITEPAIAILGVEKPRVGQDFRLSKPNTVGVLQGDMIVSGWFGWEKPTLQAGIEGNLKMKYKGSDVGERYTLKSPKPGKYEFELSVENCKTTIFKDGHVYYCDCKVKENPMKVDLEVVDSTILRISKLTFLPKELKCNYDFPADPCPDVQPVFRTGYSGKTMPTLWNYDRSKGKPAVWEENFEMVIHEKYQDITLTFEEVDTFGDDDELFSYKITSDMVNNWTSGTYSLFGGILELVIE